MVVAPKIATLVETSLYVANLEQSARFYTKVLGLEIESQLKGRHIFLIAGQSMLLLFDPKYLKHEHHEEGEKALPQIYELGKTHIAFEIDPKNYDEWKETIRNNGVAIEAEKTWQKGNRSIYFRDPDGNVVELIEPGSWPVPRRSQSSRMMTRGLVWMGVRTKEFAGMVKLLRDTLGLELTHAEEGFAVLLTGDGDKVEVFGPNWKYNKHFSSASVVGFLVDDMDEARKRLSKAGVELIGEAKKGENRYAWQHFRGPDGNIYEIVFDPQRP